MPVTETGIAAARNGANLHWSWWMVSFDFSFNAPFGRRANRWYMKSPRSKPRVDKDEPPLKLSRSEEARRILEEYADQLREIIRKFRRRPH